MTWKNCTSKSSNSLRRVGWVTTASATQGQLVKQGRVVSRGETTGTAPEPQPRMQTVPLLRAVNSRSLKE